MATSTAVLAALKQASLLHPQKRICQLIFNALDAKGLARQGSTPRDIFYIKDEVLLDALTDYAKRE